MSILDDLKARVLVSNADHETLNAVGSPTVHERAVSEPARPNTPTQGPNRTDGPSHLDDGNQSIRVAMLSPENEAMLAQLQALANENNRKWVENIIAATNDSQVTQAILKPTAGVAPQEIRCGFNIRGVYIINASGQTLYFSDSPITLEAGGEATFVASSYGLVKTGKGKAQPVFFGNNMYVRAGAAWTPGASAYAIIYALSRMPNINEYTL